MTREVYIDLYFLVNTGMDFLCLLITSALLHRKPRRWRLLLGAAVGGVYACLILLLGAAGLTGMLLDLGAALVICALAFWERRMPLARLLRAAAVQIVTSAFLGGVMTLLFSFLNRLELPLEKLEGDGPSVWVFAALALISGVFTLRGGRLLGRANKKSGVTVEATLFGVSVTLRGMVDSGNLLRDPVSGRGVMVVDRRALEGLLPSEALGEDFPTDHRIASRLRVIPVRTASGEGMLRAILPDRLTVGEGTERETVDYLVAVAPLGDRADGFEALLPPAQ